MNETSSDAVRVPIIRIGKVFLVPIHFALDDIAVARLKADVADKIHREGGDGLVIDVSGVDVIDSHLSHTIFEIAYIARLIGVRTVLCGLDPLVAMTLVDMGLDMGPVQTARDAETALALLRVANESESDFDETLEG